MSATKIWSIGDILTASDLNSNFTKLAYAQAAGEGATTTGALAADATTTVNIVYPSSRFSVAPVVQAWTSSNRYVVSIGTNTAGSAIATVRNVSAATGSDATLYWTAVQMTSSAANG